MIRDSRAYAHVCRLSDIYRPTSRTVSTLAAPALGCLLLVFAVGSVFAAQTASGSSSNSGSVLQAGSNPATTMLHSDGITLAEAIAQAKKNEPNFAATQAMHQVATLAHGNAVAALLPGVVYHNQYIYTQPQLLLPGTLLSAASQTPRFIANNATHEYVSQAAITETLSLQQAAAVAQTKALAEATAAEEEVARRGLVAAVVALYYNVGASASKLTIARQGVAEAQDFLHLTQQREAAREAAHADVIKAELELQQRQRDASDAQVAAEKARLELGVLLFADPHTNYSLASSSAALPMTTHQDFLQSAHQNNPDLAAAAASLQAAQMDLEGARAAYLPALTLNYFYGIDASQFAVNGPGGTRNLGYAATATLDIPVWDWLTTHRTVRQKASIRHAAQVALTAAQRRLVANTQEAWSEASAARDQLASLDQSRQTAQESLRLTRMRYAAGEATVLEVVDAQTSFIAASNAREDGILRYQTAIANLQILTGKL